MNHLIYISGPPCSGKTAICKCLLRIAPHFSHVSGDHFWLKHEGIAFQERVTITNQMILEAVQSMTDTYLLLEWVPSTGPFRDKLQKISEAKSRVFSHIIVYAPLSVLKQRKLDRDGDCEIGPTDINQLSSIENALVIDTTQQSLAAIVNRCIELLTSKNVLQRMPTGGV